jgi:hypothetical protein
MLADSCLIQAIKASLGTTDDDNDDDDDDPDYTNSDTESDTSDEFSDINMACASVQDPNNTTSNSRSPALEDDETNTDAPDADDRCPPLPILPDDGIDDDECGPVESGPLMNEVRFMSKKGLCSHTERHNILTTLTLSHSTNTKLSYIAHFTRFEDSPKQPP